MKSSILVAVILQFLACLAISSPSSIFLGSVLSSRSESSPNPISSLYPNNVTGTINSTLSVVPIPYTLARSIIPAQYGILTKAYHSLLKGFPADSYPVRCRLYSLAFLTLVIVGRQRSNRCWCRSLCFQLQS